MSRELLKRRVEEMKENVEEFKEMQSEFKEKIKDRTKFVETKEKVSRWATSSLISEEAKEKVRKFGLNKNKKGSMAFEWVYALIFLFVLGIFFIIYNQILTNDIVPLTDMLVPDSFVGKSEIVSDNNTWMTYWQVIPFVIFGVVLLYLFIQSNIKKPTY